MAQDSPQSRSVCRLHTGLIIAYPSSDGQTAVMLQKGVFGGAGDNGSHSDLRLA